MSDFIELIERARDIGVDEVAYPIDVFLVATEIAEHAEVRSRFRELLPLVSDPENYLTRWTAVRAINRSIASGWRNTQILA